jgi:phospholipase/carboxylesterase
LTLTALERPAAHDPAGALVLFHGRGADEYDLYPLLDLLDPERRLAGYTPRGPLELPPMGAHWYVIERVGVPDKQTFDASRELIEEWLRALPFERDRVVLGGFSQGAVMAYALALGRGQPRPAALLAFSGFVPQVDGFELDLAAPLPPVAIGHGTYDDVIPVELGRAARDLIGREHVLYREYPLPHAIDPRFVEDVARWLRP